MVQKNPSLTVSQVIAHPRSKEMLLTNRVFARGLDPEPVIGAIDSWGESVSNEMERLK